MKPQAARAPLTLAGVVAGAPFERSSSRRARLSTLMLALALFVPGSSSSLVIPPHPQQPREFTPRSARRSPPAAFECRRALRAADSEASRCLNTIAGPSSAT